MIRRLLSLLSLLGFAAVSAQAQAQSGRPVILLVHGRGMLDRDTAATRKLWFDALGSGRATITSDRILEPGDVRVVWYADVLDPRSTAACDYAPSDPRARRDAKTDGDLRNFMSLASNLLGTLAGIAEDSESVTQLRDFSADASFMSDAHKRCASEARLGAAIDRARGEKRPVIVVAHSLGSLVAYDYLSSRKDKDAVQQLVTIGSMVGATNLRALLIGGDTTDVLTMPTSVKSWVNIRNEGDGLATPLPVGRDILTAPPADEPDAHEMVGYLRGTTTAREILGAWCSAFSANRLQGCKEVIPK